LNIVFRVDSSLEIGTGHVMRCLTLAERLRLKGAECHFVCRDHEGAILERIVSQGFELSVLPTSVPGSQVVGEYGLPAHASWLRCDWRLDGEQTRDATVGKAVNWLVVDHYAIDAGWERLLNSSCEKVMVIDDLADRCHDCDFLLDQNSGLRGSDYDGLVPARCRRLFGPEYALLRPEFAAGRQQGFDRSAVTTVNHLMINLGGVDQHNITTTILDSLRTCPLPRACRITVVMGATAPWLSNVRAAAEQMPWRTEVRSDVADMAVLMLESDLAIGAAGSTSWERCCLGLPSLIVILAENQRVIAETLVSSGAAYMLDLAEDRPMSEQLAEVFDKVNRNSDELELMRDHALQLTDGHGVDLVVNQMLKEMVL
jgi:UDP-2,4-diacetamido-2,4,6-trideoxy-beta-L-altropyranose hydrolase